MNHVEWNGLMPFPFTFEGNLVGYIDRLFLPGRLHEKFFQKVLYRQRIYLKV